MNNLDRLSGIKPWATMLKRKCENVATFSFNHNGDAYEK